MDEELYEDLPGGGGDDLVQEELYDCIETFQQEGRFAPPQMQPAPPLPSVSTIPSSGPPLPARNDPPSLPPRNLQTINSLPPPTVAAPPPPPPASSAPAPLSKEALEGVKLKPAKSVKTNRKDAPASVSSSGGGIDMKIIQRAALNRGTIDLDALEKKNRKDDDDSTPPWAAQLKKRKPADSTSTTSLEGKEEENVAPWVKKKSGSLSEDSPPPQPSWVRKRQDSSSGEGPPLVARKPSKDKSSDSTFNGNIDVPPVMLRKSPAPVAPKPVKPVKPVKPSSSPSVPARSPGLSHEGAPNLRPKPLAAPNTSPRQSPKPPPRRDSIGSSFASHDVLQTSPSVPSKFGGQQKKLPPPKPQRRDVPPPSEAFDDRPPVPPPNGNIIDLGPPRFTPEPPSSPLSQPGEIVGVQPPTIPQRMPPPSVPAPPPPSESPNHSLSHPSMPRPPFSPPSIPAPPPPSGPAPPPFAPAAPHVPMAKRYRRRPVPPHDAYTPPALPHRSSKPGRMAPPIPAPVPSRPPQLKAPIGGPIPNFPPKPPAPAPEELECEEFYDDVDTVKRNMPSMQQQLQQIALHGVTTTESNVDEEGELYDDVAGATNAVINRPPLQKPPLRPPIMAPPPPPPPEAEQDDNYDLHPTEEQPTADDNYDLHPTEEQDDMYETPPLENMNILATNSLPSGVGVSNPDSDVPVEESFYEMVPTETKQQLAAASGSSTMPNLSPGMNKKVSKSEIREQKKREKEAEKERIQQEKERAIKEKERKKLEEIKLKNRRKHLSTKPFKQFGLNPDELPIIFATEVVKPNVKGKDHLILQGGEQLMVLLTSHEKLPEGKYLCEKPDGTIGFVDYKLLRDNVEGEFMQDDTYDDVQRAAFPPPSMPAPPPPS